jgi:hypothetical protein
MSSYFHSFNSEDDLLLTLSVYLPQINDAQTRDVAIRMLYGMTSYVTHHDTFSADILIIIERLFAEPRFRDVVVRRSAVV